MRWGTAAARTAATATLAGAAALAAGRYASHVALRPYDAGAANGEELTVHGTAAGQVTVSRTPASARSGVYALAGEDCHAVVGEVLSHTPDTVTRLLERVERGALDPGATVRIDSQVYSGDPRTALDADFLEVYVPGELGPMPAWHVPGVRDLWVIAAHGLGATRQQCLTALPVLRGFGLPVLVITQRNDPGAPRTADGLCHLGDTEWRDLDAAMSFAARQGAQGLVLYGWSIGATMALHAADRSALREGVRGLVLDSPVLDWRLSLRRRALERGVPAPLVPLAVRAAQGRTGLYGDRLARSAHPDSLTVPTLLIHGPDDTIAPWAVSRELGRRRDDLVVLHTVPGAGHAAMWNADPDGYEETLRRFLTPLV